MRPDANGYYATKEQNGKILCVYPLTFGRARLGIGRDWVSFDDEW